MPEEESENSDPEADEEVAGERSVIVDANALMMQFQYHVDLEQELERVMPGQFEVLVPDSVVDELENLTKDSSGKEAEEARLAIELAETFDIVEVDASGDDAIIQLATSTEDSVVVTNDKLLRAQLRAQGVPNVHMRSKAFLAVEGFPGF
jgi:rRNA-processing protein FCF1